MNIKEITENVFRPQRFPLIVMVTIVALVLLGIGWNAISSKENNQSSSVFENFGAQIIEKDGIRTSVSEYLQGDGIVCLGNKPRSKGEFNALFVGNADGMWHPVGFSVPDTGRQCVVVSGEGAVVDLFAGWNPYGFEVALDYLAGNTNYALEKVRIPFGILDGQRSSINEDYLFSVCEGGNCIVPAEFPEYAEGFLDEDEEVVVVQLFGTTRVYPIEVLSIYPIVLDEVNGFRYAVTYDWFTDKVSVFKAMINGESTSIGFVGKVHDSNILIYDFKTETWWQQFDGEGVLGPAAGYRLENLSYERTTWASASETDGALVVRLDAGKATEDNLLGQIEEYKGNERLHYIVSKKVENPKAKKEWNRFESSYKFGYVLFNDD